MTTGQSFLEFKSRFILLANTGNIPERDRFSDMCDKVTLTIQRQQLCNSCGTNEDFETLCRTIATIEAFPSE